MRTLYIECAMGAAGDMLTASLCDLLDDNDSFISEINSIGLPGIVVEKSDSVKCGLKGQYISVKINGLEEDEGFEHEHPHEHVHTHDHEHVHEHEHKHGFRHSHPHTHTGEHEHEHHSHEHSSLPDIKNIIDSLKVSDKVKQDAYAVYTRIAEAEAKVHGTDLELVHFHEVGALDAVADVVGVCMLMERAAVDRVVVSPIHVGSGTVRCAHGVLPVPTPATAEILKGIPIYSGEIRGELCTPTGAALLSYFADSFGNMPAMAIEKIGVGMGKKDFPSPNCVRTFLGTDY